MSKKPTPPASLRDFLDQLQLAISAPADDAQAQAVIAVISMGKVILARLDRLEAAVFPGGPPPLDPPPVDNPLIGK